ncbi:MAG: hypothetical protein CM1200mP26_20030 [Acidimicrobiales bacterium]|nr:MAG: hypothetical protein CM1200mP26_20030 [Acidimicrobiales bacterium]
MAELRDRQEFTFEAALECGTDSCVRKLGTHGHTRQGHGQVQPRDARRVAVFPKKMLFSKIVPNCKKLGLLDPGDGWLRDRFTDIGVIEFENWIDTGEEYADSMR